jgi:hypothetical protein
LVDQLFEFREFSSSHDHRRGSGDQFLLLSSPLGSLDVMAYVYLLDFRTTIYFPNQCLDHDLFHFIKFLLVLSVDQFVIQGREEREERNQRGEEGGRETCGIKKYFVFSPIDSQTTLLTTAVTE